MSGRLIEVEPPLQPCIDDPPGAQCATVLQNLQNPFFNEDHPGATQTTGWADAWDAAVSPYAVAAESAEDVAAAVKFAREHGVRLVVKGTGHDYLGRSNAPNSLLIWTHPMRDVTVHDDFRITGGDGRVCRRSVWAQAPLAGGVTSPPAGTAGTSRAAAAPVSARPADSSRAAASAVSRSGSAPVRRACWSTKW